MELLLSREWTKLLRVGNDLRNIEIFRARLEQADAAFGLVREYFAMADYARIYLDTASQMVAAARLYERNGYERCGRYNDNPQAAIFMRKKL